MSNISQVNNYTKVKQLTNKDARQFGPLVHDYEEFTSSASQTVLNLSKIVCNLSYKSSVQVYVDGKLLREGSGNDYQWTSVSGGMSSQITFEYALPADLNIIVIRIGATAQSLPNASSVQANVNSTRLEVDKKDNANGIINGSFEYWQRGTSFAAVAALSYSSDRWQYSKSSTAVHTISRSTDVPTTAFGQYSLLVDCTTADASVAAGDFVSIRQNTEGNFFRRFKNKNIVLKFWVKATKTGVSCVSFRNSGGTRSLVKEYTINQANTWEQKTIRFTHDSTETWDYGTGIGMRVEWNLMSGTTFQTTPDTWQNGNFLATSNQVNHTDNAANDFQLADVHFCEDNFDQTKDPEFQLAGRDLQAELLLCKRYYERLPRDSVGFLAGVTGTTTSFQASRKMFEPKRVAGLVNISPALTDGVVYGAGSISIANTLTGLTNRDCYENGRVLFGGTLTTVMGDFETISYTPVTNASGFAEVNVEL